MESKIEKIDEVYGQTPLTNYSRKQKFLIRAADIAFFLLINTICKTVRFETEGMEHFDEVARTGKVPIYTFWHNRIFAGTYYFRKHGIVVITSQSFDGEYIARFIKRFGYGAVRGSSTRGGVGALIETIRLMRKGLPAGITVDGPKGPLYVVKSGVCTLAKKTGNPMVPFVVECANFWELKSWDKLQIPKPFSRAKIFVAPPIYVAADADENETEVKRAELQNVLDETTELAKQWRKSF